MMIKHSISLIRFRSAPRYLIEIRLYSTENESIKKAPKKKLSSAQLRKQRNTLAVSSLKDIFESFMPSSGDDEVYQIDPKPIYAEPKKYLTLNQPLQQCVLDDLQLQLKKKWKLIPQDVKRFHYFLSYENHGPRESFPSIDSVEPPLDLPFRSKNIKTTSPTPDTKISKQNFNVNLNRLGPKRLKQADKDSRMDPVSKGILFIVFLLTLLNYKRDSKVQSSGKVPVNKYELSLVERLQLEEEMRLRYEQHEEITEPTPVPSKKWYYLWLK